MKNSKRIALVLGIGLLALATNGFCQAQPPGSFTFRQTTGVCSTSGVAGNPCAEPTVLMPTSFSTAGNYACVATCVGGITGAPVVQSITKAVASPKIQVNIAALTAATASCTEVDVTCLGLNAPAQ